jgi:lipopolysaccharide/colanic/teichoic acid biosynthesis glycosyltransferase
MSSLGHKIRDSILGYSSSAQGREHAVFPTNITIDSKPIYGVVTAAYNVLAASLGLLILAPLMSLLALGVKLTSSGPAFYRGERVGKGERPFHIYKFRTMKVGSEAQIGQRLVQQDEDHFTPIGRFLRKYRLDELPQLFNVLFRDMNLVGPRPVRPIFLEQHKADVPGYERRFIVRPGITGQAQVRGGYYTSARHKLFYEMLHIARRSVIFDLQLVILTFARVMTRIFTTTLLLCWLLVMVLVAPPEFTAAMSLSVGSLTFNVLYLVPTLIAVAHLSQRRMEHRRVVALRTPSDMPLIGFLVCSIVIVPFSPMPLEALRGVGWWLCNGIVVFYLVMNSRMVTDRRDALIAVLVTGTTVMGLLELVPRIVEWIDSGSLDQLVGPLFSPTLMSATVILALPLAVTRALSPERGWSQRLYRLAALILLLVTTLTLSRAGILTTGLVLTLILWNRARLLALSAIGCLTFIIIALGISGDKRMHPAAAWNDFSQASARQAVVLDTILQDDSTTTIHQFTGIGGRVMERMAQRSHDRKPRLHFSNMFLTMLVDFGPIGALFFIFFVLRSHLYVFRQVPRVQDESARADLRAAAAGTLGCTLLFLVSDTLSELPLMLTYFAALGLAIGVATHYGPDPRRVLRIIQYRHNL